MNIELTDDDKEAVRACLESLKLGLSKAEYDRVVQLCYCTEYYGVIPQLILHIENDIWLKDMNISDLSPLVKDAVFQFVGWDPIRCYKPDTQSIVWHRDGSGLLNVKPLPGWRASVL